VYDAHLRYGYTLKEIADSLGLHYSTIRKTVQRVEENKELKLLTYWTDQKVKVHAFLCITGLLLSQALWKKTREAGYTISIETLLDRLTEVREAEMVRLSGMKGKPVKEKQLEDMEPELLELYQTLDTRGFPYPAVLSTYKMKCLV